MSIVSVRASLEVALNGMSPALATSWDNESYTPVIGTPYQFANLLPAEPDNRTIGGGHYQEQGIFQVTLMYPLQNGTSAAMLRAELLRSTFYRGSTFTSGANRVVIEKTPEIGVGTVDGDRWRVPVRIRFFSFN